MNRFLWHVIVTVTCVAALVAAVAVTAFHRTAPLQIATVRLHEVLAEHITARGSTAMTDEQRLAAASDYAEALEAAVRALAERENIVILAANAVVSGTEDLTDALRDELTRRLKP